MPDTTDQAPLATPFLTLAANLRARECSAVEKTLLEAVALVLIALAAMLDEFEAERLQATGTTLATTPAPAPITTKTATRAAEPRAPASRAPAPATHARTPRATAPQPRPEAAHPPPNQRQKSPRSATPKHALFVPHTQHTAVFASEAKQSRAIQPASPHRDGNTSRYAAPGHHLQ